MQLEYMIHNWLLIFQVIFVNKILILFYTEAPIEKKSYLYHVVNTMLFENDVMF